MDENPGQHFDPAKPPAPSGPVVDYTLARRAVIADVRRGLTSYADACDAHPELLRAGRNIGEVSPRACPICSHPALKIVRYVYGEELGRNSGRVVYPPEWLHELATTCPLFTCYVVEVCIDCHWNHLIRSYVTGSEPEPETEKRRLEQNRG